MGNGVFIVFEYNKILTLIVRNRKNNISKYFFEKINRNSCVAQAGCDYWQGYMVRTVNALGVGNPITRPYGNGNSNVEKVKMNSEVNFKIFPNPVTTSLTVSFDRASNEQKTITVYDSKLARIKTLTTNNTQFSLPTSSWSKGVYILQIKTADAVQTKQFVVGN